MAPAVKGYYTTSLVTSGTPSVNVTQPVAASDVFVLFLNRGTASTSIAAPTGLGVTWTAVTAAANATVDVFTATGATAGGAVTGTTASDTSGQSMALYQLTGVTTNVYGMSNQTAAGTFPSPTVAGRKDQIVLFNSFTDNAAGTFVSPAPAAGWTQQTNLQTTSTRYVGSAYRLPTETKSVAHNASVTRSSGNGFTSIVTVGGPASRYNLFKDPEASALTGWVDSYDTGNALTADTSQKYVGTQSLRFTHTSATAGRATVIYGGSSTGAPNAYSIPCTAGGAITVSAYLRNAANAPGVMPLIWWQTTTGYASITTGPAVTTGATWQRVSLTATVPSGISQFAFGFRINTANLNDAFNIDGIQVERGNLTSYFSGNTVSAGNDDVWLGTAGNASSYEIASLTTGIASALSGAGTLASSLAYTKRVSSALSGTGTLSAGLHRNISSTLSGNGTLSAILGNFITSGLSGSGTLSSALHRDIHSNLSGSGVLASYLHGQQTIASALSGTGALTSYCHQRQQVQSRLSANGWLSSALVIRPRLTSAFGAEGVLYSELAYNLKPAELGTTPLGKLSSFTVTTAAVPLNPAEGAGSAPSVNAGYIKGTNPEFLLGETNVLSHGSVGSYEGEVVSLSLPEGSAVASISQDTPLTLLNTELQLYPFIDSTPSTWTAARAIDYWTQQCGLFYDKVPGDCIAYTSGFGHADGYGADTTGRFYEKLTGGTTSTVLVGNRSVKSLGTGVTGTTAFHDSPNAISAPAVGTAVSSLRLLSLPWSTASIVATGSGINAIKPPSIAVPLSVPANRKLVASIGLGLHGTGRTATVTWNLMDAKQAYHDIVISATSEGAITASLTGVPLVSTTVPANANYRITCSIERTSDTSVAAKLSVHTDDLAGTGTLVYASQPTVTSYALPTVAYLSAITHDSAGGSGDEMLRWGTYLSVATAHPMTLPAVQKAFTATLKPFGFVSGFIGNVWSMLNEYCAITRQDASFQNSRLTVSPRLPGLSAPASTFSKFSRNSQRRDKYKQVAVLNKQSVAVSTNDGVLWRADSVYQVAAREVFETTVQTVHSILTLAQPVPVGGISPFPYTQGGGQYVVTGADGYIVSAQWWIDNGGSVQVSQTDKAGEIAIRITAPTVDTVRAPYRISEGAADRPALYVCGSGILNTPLEVHVGTGAKNAKEGFDTVFDSPFMAGVMETYDTAAAMAAQYSASVADADFSVPNDFNTPSRFGQVPVGTRFTDGSRTYRIATASQTHSMVSGQAVPNTTVSDYVASYPAGSTIADEKARHRGRTIKQLNISPLRGTK